MAANKPDWRNVNDYAFTENLDHKGWAWEFLRRNPEYRGDYVALQDGRSEIRKSTPHLRMGADVVEYGPDVVSAEEALGMKWGMERAVDPDGDRFPSFSSIYPKELEWSDVDSFFAAEDDESPVLPVPPFVVLAFDLNADLKAQIDKAHRLLDSRSQEPEYIERRWRTQWTNYLRLLDVDEGASTKEIIDHFAEYKVLENSAATSYQVTDRVSDHKKAARELRDNPLTILKK